MISIYFFAVLFRVVRNVSSIIVIISVKKNARKNGITSKPSALPRSPNSGGMNVEPTYALAIWIPIIAPEFSAPKFDGVEWIMHG